MRRALAVTAATAILATGTVMGTSTAAMAEGGCSGDYIVINDGDGAESMSTAYGHHHSTGSHYIAYYEGNVAVWYADNDGGLDGDTADTWYTDTLCI